MPTVTSAEFQKNFGQYRERAQREPVAVTSYGRDSVVLISAAEFERFKRLDDRQAYLATDMPDDMLQALENEITKSSNITTTILTETQF